MIGALCYLLLMGATGYVASGLLCPDARGTAWRAGLALVLGAAITGLVLQAVSLLGRVPSRAVLGALALACAAGAVFVYRSGRFVRADDDERSTRGWQRGLAVLVVGISLAAAARLALDLPPEWDGTAIWLLKAKVLALQPLAPLPAYFTDAALSYSHLDYPLLVPFLVAGAIAAAGAPDSLAMHAVFLYVDVAAMLLVLGALRLRLGVLESTLVCAALFLTPAWLRWSVAPTADAALALFHVASLALALDAARHGRVGCAIAAAIVVAASAQTKLEGLPLAGIDAVVFCALALSGRPRRVRTVIVFLAVVAALYLPWLVFSQALPHTHEDYAGRLDPALVATNLPRLAEQIVPALAGQALAWNRWGLVWLLPLLLAIAGWRALRDRGAVLLWLAFGAQLALYALAYLITPWDVRVLLAMTLERVLVQAAPVAALLAGVHAAVLTPSARSPAPSR